MDCNTHDIKNRQVVNLLIEDRYRIFRHLIMLIGFMIILFNTKGREEYAGMYEFYSLLITYVLFVFMFYINMYVLVPAFFFRAKYIQYIVLLMIMVGAGIYFVSEIMIVYFEPHRIIEKHIEISQTRVIISATIFLTPFIMVTTTLKLIQRWVKDNERLNELKNLTLSMELNELKNQINPHFLFNMLNSVNVLTKANPDKASLVILKLSEFLRYQLYENNEEKTALISEINFLSNFLNLEKIRRDNFIFTINTQTASEDYKKVFIPPNLFTNFIENAVKHSVDISDQVAFIKIDLEIKDKILYFVCTNSKSAEDITSNDKNSGLGLVNVRRRLDLLYGEAYNLTLTEKKNSYTVNLNFPI